MQPGGKRDDVIIEERVAGLDAVSHGDSITLVIHQQSRQHDLVAEVERLVERGPSAHAFQVKRQILVSVLIAQSILQVSAEVAVPRLGYEVIEKHLRVRSPYGRVDASKIVQFCPWRSPLANEPA